MSSQQKKEVLQLIGKEVAVDETPNVTVFSAVLLEQEEKNKLARALGKLFGKTLSFDYRLDRKLLGGLKIVFGDTTIDVSLSYKLEKIMKELVKDNE